MGLSPIEDMLQVLLQNDYVNQTEMMGVEVAVPRHPPPSPSKMDRSQKLPLKLPEAPIT